MSKTSAKSVMLMRSVKDGARIVAAAKADPDAKPNQIHFKPCASSPGYFVPGYLRSMPTLLSTFESRRAWFIHNGRSDLQPLRLYKKGAIAQPACGATA